MGLREFLGFRVYGFEFSVLRCRAFAVQTSTYRECYHGGTNGAHSKTVHGFLQTVRAFPGIFRLFLCPRTRL